jgi:uncharacterized protein YbaA (DUF1428 family)
MAYVDGYVLAVPTACKQDYLRVAGVIAEVFKAHGALSVIECWGDDVPDGELTSFPRAVHCRADETVVFSWIVWPSKEIRDRGMKAAMEDERVSAWGPEDMPFDGKRMIMGGFEVIVDQ